MPFRGDRFSEYDEKERDKMKVDREKITENLKKLRAQRKETWAELKGLQSAIRRAHVLEGKIGVLDNDIADYEEELDYIRQVLS